MGGVYAIQNKLTAKEYIGITQNFATRFNRHRYELRHGRHHCLHLQRAWDKYGEEAFVFVILKECGHDEAVIIEQGRLLDLSNLYNVSQCSQGGDLISTHPERTKIIDKMRTSINHRYKNMTFVERQKIYGRSGIENGMYGRTHTDEAKSMMSARFKGKGGPTHHNFGIKRSAETRMKMSKVASERTGQANPFYGKHHSAETREKIAAKKRGNKPKNMRPVLINGEVYVSVTEAARQLEISPALVIYRIKSVKYDYTYTVEDSE